MKMRPLFLFICLISLGAPCLSHASLWEKYDSQHLLSYQSFHEIPFNQLTSTPIETGIKTDVSLCDKDPRFEKKLWEILNLRGISSWDQISTLSVQQSLDLTFSIVGKQIQYRFVRDGEKMPEYDHPSSTDCFVEGCGACGDYSFSVTKIFELFKQHNPLLTNIMIGEISDDLSIDATEKTKPEDIEFYTSKGLTIEEMNLHAWNYILVFFPDRAVYSYFNVTSCYQCFGKFSEAHENYGWSKYESLNKSRLFQALGEYEPALTYFKSFFGEFNLYAPDENKTNLYKRGANLATISGSHDIAFQYNLKSYHRTQSTEDLENLAKSALLSDKFASSLYYYKKLFNNEKAPKEKQINYLEGIRESLVGIDQPEQFLDYYEIAVQRKILH